MIAGTGLNYQMAGAVLEHSEQLEGLFVSAEIVTVKKGISLHNDSQVANLGRFACSIGSENLRVALREEFPHLLCCLFFAAEAAYYCDKRIRGFPPDGLNCLAGEIANHSVFAPFLVDIYYLHLCGSGIRQVQEVIFAAAHIQQGLKRRAAAAENQPRAADGRKDCREVAAIVARRGLRLFVGGILLLIHDYEAQAGVGEK